MGKYSKISSYHISISNKSHFLKQKNRCGEPNMYMAGFKCKVTNSISNIALAKPNPPVWCEGNPNNCTKGAKQFIGWNQHDGNNIEVDGFDLEGGHKSPAYNMKLGFANGEFLTPFFSSSLYGYGYGSQMEKIGAQNDIFGDTAGNVDIPVSVPSSAPSSSAPASTPVNTPVNNAPTPVTTPTNDPPTTTPANNDPTPANDPPPANNTPANSPPPPPVNSPSVNPPNNKALCRSRNPTSKKRSAVYDENHSKFAKKSTIDFSSHRRNSRFLKLRHK